MQTTLDAPDAFYPCLWGNILVTSLRGMYWLFPKFPM